MNRTKVSARKPNPTGLLPTGGTGGIARRRPLTTQRSVIAHTRATARIATSCAHLLTGTGGDEQTREAKLKPNTVRATGGCVVCLRVRDAHARIFSRIHMLLFERRSFPQMVIV